MLDRGRIHQGHVREIRDVSTCTAQHVGAARRSIWRDVTFPWQRPRYQRSGFMAWRHVAFTEKKTYPLQTCYEHNMLSLLHAVCLKVLVFFLNTSVSTKPTAGSGNAGTCEKLHDRSRIRLLQKAGVCASALILQSALETSTFSIQVQNA